MATKTEKTVVKKVTTASASKKPAAKTIAATKDCFGST